uniref:Major facilitator superfamily associated domain-containing protein n=1 Tax=Setaria digitata TaxID=48799 RepID=A0A915PN23_9BILA
MDDGLLPITDNLYLVIGEWMGVCLCAYPFIATPVGVDLRSLGHNKTVGRFTGCLVPRFAGSLVAWLLWWMGRVNRLPAAQSLIIVAIVLLSLAVDIALLTR